VGLPVSFVTKLQLDLRNASYSELSTQGCGDDFDPFLAGVANEVAY
jgi:hypothetical protein